MRGYLVKHIIPYFKDIKLQNITAKLIEDWVMKLRETPGKNGKPLSHSTVNHVLINEISSKGMTLLKNKTHVSYYGLKDDLLI